MRAESSESFSPAKASSQETVIEGGHNPQKLEGVPSLGMEEINGKKLNYFVVSFGTMEKVMKVR